MEIKKLLEVKELARTKKPKFVRRDVNKKAKLGRKWHRPKGIQNKMRLHEKGYPRTISSGYRSPKLVRGLTKEGLRPVVISNLTDLSKINTQEEIAIISSTVGQRKKLTIANKAKELNIVVKNLRDIEGFISDVQEEMKYRKEGKQVKSKLKQEREKEAKKKAEEKIAEDKKADAESKQDNPEKQIEAEDLKAKQVAEKKNKVLTQKM